MWNYFKYHILLLKLLNSVFSFEFQNLIMIWLLNIYNYSTCEYKCVGAYINSFFQRILINLGVILTEYEYFHLFLIDRCCWCNKSCNVYYSMLTWINWKLQNHLCRKRRSHWLGSFIVSQGKTEKASQIAIFTSICFLTVTKETS